LAINLDAVILNIIVSTIVLSPVLWLSGRAIVGKRKAKFSDSILIVVVGVVVGAIFSAFFKGIFASVIQLILWLFIVKHFFDCGWLKAFIISILVIIVYVIIFIILGLMGFALIFI
jgi:hypothetical protein